MWRGRDSKQKSQDADKSSSRGFAADAPDRISLSARLRAYFLAGVIVTAPIGITAFLVWQFITFLDSQVGSLIPGAATIRKSYLPFSVPGLGLLIMLAFLTLVGFWPPALPAARWCGSASACCRACRSCAASTARSSRSSRPCWRSPRARFARSCWSSIRAAASARSPSSPVRADDEKPSSAEDELVNVFLPTTPNPTSGFLLFVPRKDLVHLDMTVEEGIKLVISGGIVGPRIELRTLEALAQRAGPEDMQEQVEPEEASRATLERDADAAQDAEQAELERLRIAAR